MTQDALGETVLLHPAVRSWFAESLGQPTEPQSRGWAAIGRGDHTLIEAPTGSGKTLAAFLVGISELYRDSERGWLQRPPGVQILYVSPLRALNNDIHRNLEIPLAGIAAHASRLGLGQAEITTAVRTGDTPPDERRRLLRRPPHILITTPESLSLMLTSAARTVLRSVRTVIIDEIHALFPNKRGAQLALALEQLAAITARPFQRIGLSATQRPIGRVAGFLGGGIVAANGQPDRGPAWQGRPVTVIQAPGRKELDLAVILPAADFANLPEHGVWPEIYRRVWQLVDEHRSTLIFVNNRQAGERLAAAINDLAGGDVARVHHGSIAREQRLATEQLLRAGDLRCLVATSTLELGIDVGWIDLVIQVESPHEVARGLQRVGRAGHVPGACSKGRLVPKSRSDLLEAAVVAREMLTGNIEPAVCQDNAIDVLAQFIVAATIHSPLTPTELYDLVRRAYNYRGLCRESLEAVLRMLGGDYDLGPSLGIQPLVRRDPATGSVSATARGRRLVHASGGTIADRGEYPVHLDGTAQRLGELDEEYVSERRVGDRLTLGTSSWRITRITPDRVLVAPATGGPPVPFWRGETQGRSYLLGRAMADFLADAEATLASGAGAGPHGHRGEESPGRDDFLASGTKLSAEASSALRQYLLEQRMATGVLPSSQHMVIEEFPDELGNWRTVLHSPFGRRVNEPLSQLLLADAALKPDIVVTDDAVLFAWGPTDAPGELDLAKLVARSDHAHRLAEILRATPLYGRLFREAASRALFLPRRPGWAKRTPLWLARRRSAAVLEAASAVAEFPLLYEAAREALASYWDLGGLTEVLGALGCGAAHVVRVRRRAPSPFARPAVFAAEGAFMYGDDLPHAERRLRHSGLDPDSLRQLLGQAPLRQLLDQASIGQVRRPAAPAALRERPPASVDDLHWWLRRFGELPATRDLAPSLQEQLLSLSREARALVVSWYGPQAPGPVWIASEDVPDYAALPRLQLTAQAPAGFHQPEPPDPAAISRLVMRFARRTGPFDLAALVAYYGLAAGSALSVLDELVARGELAAGEFTPGGSSVEWVEPKTLASIHRHSLARARRAVEPRSAADYAAFLLDWHGIPGGFSGVDGLASSLHRLRGHVLPAAEWDGLVLPLRVAGYRPELLERLITSGQFRWLASGQPEAPRVEFWPAPLLRQRARASAQEQETGTMAARLREQLAMGGPAFLQDLWQELGGGPKDVIQTIVAMAIRGEVTNDSFGPVRNLLARSGTRTAIAQPLRLTPAVLAAMGRWSLAARPQSTPAEQVDDLLDCFGLVSREVASASGHLWSVLQPELARREALGTVRRGYFVRGLSGLQYALPDAVERMRHLGLTRSQTTDPTAVSPAVALAWYDPALAWGKILEWPADLPRQRPPYWLVMRSGEPRLSASGSLLHLHTAEPKPSDLALSLDALIASVGATMPGRLEIATYNGEPTRWTVAADILADRGFIAGPERMVRYRDP